MPKYTAIINQATTSPRPGTAPAIHAPTPEPILAGLELSEIVYKPASWFHLNPANEVFRALKSEQYYDDLTADIRANGIMENLVAMPDGLILAGESRVICAGRITPEIRLPVRIVLSELSLEEQERRLILSNLLRFEIPDDVRLVLAKRAGLFSAPRGEAAKVMGKSLRQVKRDAATIREAESLAASEGRPEPTPEDVKAAREKRNATRKAPSTGTKKVAIIQLEAILLKLNNRGGAYAEAAQFIREELGI